MIAILMLKLCFVLIHLLELVGAYAYSSFETYRICSTYTSRSSVLQTQGDSIEYEYLDSGNHKRLERFGNIVLTRPCPSASWKPGLSKKQWREASVTYEDGGWSGVDNIPLLYPELNDGDGEAKSSTEFDWKVRINKDLVFTLSISTQGQIGIFPEQISNWAWIRFMTTRANLYYDINDDTNEEEKLHVLNCFGYTGGSTLAALGTANVNVTHVDASRTFVNWCKRNVDASGIVSNLPDMRLYKEEEEDNSDDNKKKDQGPPSRCRFLVDDTLSFLKREVRRGKKYNGIILDPPAFGRGPKTKGQNKTWKIDRDLPELIDLLPQLMHPRKPGFLLLTNHDEAFPPNTVVNMLRRAKLPKRGVYESGNMVLRSEVGGEDLPMGSFVRISWLAGR
jgi:23S rRNA (cytosine1962-C5)-methyltransferase